MNSFKITVWLALAALIISACTSQPQSEEEGGSPSNEDGETEEEDDVDEVPPNLMSPRQQRQRRNPCNGTWAAWESWSSCSSRFCGFNGRRTRVRSCMPPRRLTRRCERRNEYPCPRNTSLETATCNGCGDTGADYLTTIRPRPRTQGPYYPTGFPSPRDPDGSTCNTRGNQRGQWGPWGCWSQCINGERSRYRHCNGTPPVGRNMYCIGSHEDFESCNNNDRFRPTDIPRTRCLNGQDVVLAIDASNSVGQSNFDKMTESLRRVLSGFNLDTWNSRDSSKVRVGILTFANSAQVINRLDQYWLPTGITYTRGSRRIDQAIYFARNTLFNFSRGDRYGNQNVLVILTDGNSSNQLATANAARSFKSGGGTILVWGIGRQVDSSELREIASNESDVYTVRNYDELERELDRVFRC